jgi:imidazolonepropionase
MNTIIQNLKTLTHFDSSGEFFTRKNVSILIDKSGTIQKIQSKKIPKKSKTKIIDGSNLIGLPSYVDCHSHTLFGGNRANEFQLKCEGKSYLEIAAMGGGIPSTQNATAEASDEELMELVSKRIAKFIAQGVRGLEIKTGYGLSHDEEIRHLRLLNKIKKKHQNKIKIWVTYLGPHAVLKNVDKDDYLDEICLKTLPLIAKENLSDFVDIFVDEGFFSAKDMEKYCNTAEKLRLKVKAHIDEIKNLGGAEIAAKYNLVSVDHCRHTSVRDFEKLKVRGVQVVFLPATSFYIEEGFVNMNELRKTGIQPAISLDYNPGSQPSLWWPFVMYLGLKKMRMTEAELLHATTIAPLNAVNIKPQEWCFEKGMKCKLNLFEASSVSELAYRFGENLLVHSIFYA